MKEKFEFIYINGEQSIYMISNKGRCINTKRNTFLKPLKKEYRKRLLEPIDKSNRYYGYSLYHKNKYYHFLIHRLVAIYFIDIPQKYLDEGLTMNDLVVDHIDNYRPNNSSDNLQWLTPEENFHKMLNSGNFRIPKGTKHPNCKLTDEQLELTAILLSDNKLTYREISDITGVPINTIYEIRAGRRFKYLSDKYDFSNYNVKSKPTFDKKVIIKIIDMIQNTDYSLSKIAEYNGVSKSLVKDIYKRRCHIDLSKKYDFSRRENK